MKRKVIQHGPATLVVSLPSVWVKKFGVLKGNEVDVFEEGNALRIGTKLQSPNRSIQLDVADLDRTTFLYLLRSLYRFGYDTIVINDPPEKIYYIKEQKDIPFDVILSQELARMQGIEIMERSKKRLLLTAVHTPNEDEFDALLRRLFHIVIEASNAAKECLANPSEQTFAAVDRFDDDATRIASYCLRLLNKKQYKHFLEMTSLYRTIALLDRVIGVIKNAARDAVKHNISLTPKHLEIVEDVTAQLRDYTDFFYQFKKEKIASLARRRYELEEKLIQTKGTQPQMRLLTQICMVNQLLTDLKETRYPMLLSKEQQQ